MFNNSKDINKLLDQLMHELGNQLSNGHERNEMMCAIHTVIFKLCDL